MMHGTEPEYYSFIFVNGNLLFTDHIYHFEVLEVYVLTTESCFLENRNNPGLYIPEIGIKDKP